MSVSENECRPDRLAVQLLVSFLFSLTLSGQRAFAFSPRVFAARANCCGKAKTALLLFRDHAIFFFFFLVICINSPGLFSGHYHDHHHHDQATHRNNRPPKCIAGEPTQPELALFWSCCCEDDLKKRILSRIA